MLAHLPDCFGLPGSSRQWRIGPLRTMFTPSFIERFGADHEVEHRRQISLRMFIWMRVNCSGFAF
jgi:hypothetical protein